MTDPIAKAMFRRRREEERARITGSYAEADRFARKVFMHIVGAVGALVVLMLATAALVTIDRHTGNLLTQWFK